MNPIRFFVAPLTLLSLGGCFASQSDIQVLQGDLKLVRAESAQADSARRAQLDRVIAMLRTTNDSLAAMSGRVTRLRGDVTTRFASMEAQLLQIQELTGQSQTRLQEVRASLEARQQAAMAPTAGGAAGTDSGTGGPGPNQLFQLARDQLLRGSNAAARTAFQDLLTRYPKADVAADAQFYVGEAYAGEGNAEAADSVYAEVVRRYPSSARAATALYKRATGAQASGSSARARQLFNEIIRKYPRSDEAALARDRVKALR